MTLKNHKCSKEQFSEMTLLEKRTYILQNQQEDTNWWITTVAKIQVISIGIGFILGLLFILFSNL
jgi:hypothetical protein